MALREAPLAELSIRELARRVGVSANAPYRHFPDRSALLAALAAWGYEQVAAELERRTDEGARAVGEVWSAFAAGDPDLAVLMTDPGIGAGAEVSDAAARWFRAVVAAVEQDLPDVSPERVLARAIGCWAAVQGLERLRRSGVLVGLEDLMPAPRRLALRAVGA